MAKVIGNPGGSANETAHRIFRCQLYISSGAFLVAGTVLGLCIPRDVSGFITAIFVPLALTLGVHFFRRVDVAFGEYQRDRENWRRGADGEILVAEALRIALSDDYFVINDIIKHRGNIDHVVIGPTGVFAINSKCWRGTVKPDGQGELIINGKATSGREIHRLAGTAKDINRFIVRKTGFDAFVQPLMIFESTRVEVPPGTTGVVRCLWKEQAAEFIESRKHAQLSVDQIKSIAAVLARFNGASI